MTSDAKPQILDHAALLADFTRCRVLALVDRHELTVSEIQAVLQLPQSTVSRHLKVLADGDWVSSRSEGTSRLYQLPPGGLEAPRDALWSLVREELIDSTTAVQDRLRLDSILRERSSRSQEFFSTTAGEWDRLRDELFGTRFDLLALAGLADAAWTLGDLGCGTGRLSEALAPWVREVIAVDGSPAMLDAARGRLAAFPNVKIREGQLENLPIDDARLDVATLFLALHHVPEPERVLAEARRVLRPGGRLVVVDMLPHDRESFRRQMGHIWLGFSGEHMQRLLGEAGFDDVRLHPLPASPDAQGPTLFAATVVRPVSSNVQIPQSDKSVTSPIETSATA